MNYGSVLGAINRGGARSVNRGDFTELKVIGTHEIALRKGHRDFVVIATLRRDDENMAPLGAPPGRKKETVALFLRSIPLELRASIERVCADLRVIFVAGLRIAATPLHSFENRRRGR